MATANDQDIGHNLVIVLLPLLLPRYGTGHVAISRIELRELEERFGDGVHSPQTPSLLSVDSVDNGRSLDKGSIERQDKLEEGKVGVRLLDGRRGFKELEVGAVGGWQKVGGSTSNVLGKVEGSVVPSEGKLVPPNT